MVPTAAVTVEDALLIERLAACGPVTMKLVLTPQTLPDVQSHNVIADLPGREHPEEIVLVSSHLDSWDLGTGAPVDATNGKALAPLLEALRPIGAGVLDRREGHAGSDIAPLQDAGVPGFAPLVDGRHYFALHHTPADTFDKVDADAMRRQVAVLAVLADFLAEREEPIRTGR